MRGNMPKDDITVDQIIERVLIRSNQQPHTYSKKPEQLLTSQQHLWHYQLQQQSLELKEKVKNLTLQLRKKVEQREKLTIMQKQMQELRVELKGVSRSNQHLQQELNQMRLKNSSINDSIQQSLDESLRARQHNRSCSCLSSHHQQKKNQNRPKKDQIRINESTSSPEKEILKKKKDVSVMCLMALREDVQQTKITDKQEHIKALKKLVQNQEKLLSSYRRQIEQKKAKTLMSKNKTMQSTQRLAYPFQRTTSHNTFKPISSAGSIVKVRRG